MSSIHIDHDGGVTVITIDRTERRNAIDFNTAQEIAAALDQLDSRTETAVGVLTGAGGTFCAGMDLKALSATGKRPDTESRGMFGITRRPPLKPLIAAVEGHALGGGLEIALACDLIVSASDATFGFPEVKHGLVAAAGGLIRIPRHIPQSAALEMVLTGEPINATRAHELGLVSRLTAPGEALSTATALADRIATNAPLAVRAAKKILVETQQLSIEAAFKQQGPVIERVRSSEDAREGALAFSEKRQPSWRGC